MGQEFWDPASRDAGDAQEKKVRPDLDATIARMVFFVGKTMHALE